MNFILRRTTAAIFAVWGVITLVFLLMRLLPGDPVLVILGEQARPSEVEMMRHELGLDKPLHIQYVDFLKNVIKGDFGKSYYYQEKVASLLKSHLKITVLLAVFSFILSVIISFVLGGISAVLRGRLVDRFIIAFSQIGVAIPNFWLGPIFIILFSIKLPLFPVSGFYGLNSLVLPSLTLGVSLSSFLTRIVRSAVIDVIEAPYVIYAKAKGISSLKVCIHVLRNALIPILTVMGLQMGALLAGAVITERVFSLPGIGTLLVRGIEMRDYPVVQGCILTISLSYVLVNFVVDVLYSWIDPRVELR